MMMTRHGTFHALACGVLLLWAGLALAQQTTGGLAAPQAARYFLGREDEILMQVNVWGFVRQPGQYMVPYDTDLISLLSYAGGPREEAKIKSVKVIRASSGEGGAPQVIEVDVKKFLKSADASMIPRLKPGDTVVVSGTTFHFVSKFFEFVWRIALVVQIVFMADYYSRQARR
ncbi:MAG: SLBB domain-containing protein [bacterium]|nr:SLBB domain-containing protein [candidate division KSB1 bacterium]MDH7559847.1 SLBB domain-containing protein [bacterium]